MPEDRIRSRKRRKVSLTVSEDLLEDARALSINLSQAAEGGIEDAVKSAREQAWREENRKAIAEYNAWIERDGVPFPPDWLDA